MNRRQTVFMGHGKHCVTGKTMKKSTSIIKAAVLGMLLISLQGCVAMSNNAMDIDPGSVYDTIIEHTIEPGDRLVDLSAKYTGDGNQWSAIAAYNDITDPRSLRIGDVIAIPYSLIPEELRTAELKLSTRNLEGSTTSLDVAGNSGSPAALPVTPTNTMALKREPVAPASDVLVQSVVINRTFDLNPIDESELRPSRPSSGEMPQVRVVGTYYPKGVYQQPASYSTLMMRVAPGTVFELEREVNDWYKVITADGVGYLRAVDGIIEMPN